MKKSLHFGLLRPKFLLCLLAFLIPGLYTQASEWVDDYDDPYGGYFLLDPFEVSGSLDYYVLDPVTVYGSDYGWDPYYDGSDVGGDYHWENDWAYIEDTFGGGGGGGFSELSPLETEIQSLVNGDPISIAEQNRIAQEAIALIEKANPELANRLLELISSGELDFSAFASFYNEFKNTQTGDLSYKFYAGFYSSDEKGLFLVINSESTPELTASILVHEAVHALQHFDEGRSTANGDSVVSLEYDAYKQQYEFMKNHTNLDLSDFNDYVDGNGNFVSEQTFQTKYGENSSGNSNLEETGGFRYSENGG